MRNLCLESGANMNKRRSLISSYHVRDILIITPLLMVHGARTGCHQIVHDTGMGATTLLRGPDPVNGRMPSAIGQGS